MHLPQSAGHSLLCSALRRFEIVPPRPVPKQTQEQREHEKLQKEQGQISFLELSREEALHSFGEVEGVEARTDESAALVQPFEKHVLCPAFRYRAATRRSCYSAGELVIVSTCLKIASMRKLCKPRGVQTFLK